MQSSGLLHSLVVLGPIVLLGCSGSDAPAAAAAPKAESQTALAPAPAPAGAPASVPAGHEPVDVKMGGVTVHMEGNTIESNGGATADALSVVDVEIAGEPRLKLTVRVDPALAPQLLQEIADQKPSSFSLEATEGARVTLGMTVAQPSFTIAGRTIDVSGGKLSVCGIAMGTIADYDTITLARGEVRVEDRFRGPLPAPVAR